MIKCETHLHTCTGSPCGQTSPEQIAKLYLKAGYKAIVSTNHYMKYIFNDFFPDGDMKSKIKYFIDNYNELKYHCGKVGIKVFLGMELTPTFSSISGMTPLMDILCYGLTEDFLYSYPELYKYSPPDLFNLFNQNKILCYQAHPYRGYCTQSDPRYIHGIEVYNGHPGHDSHNNLALKYAEDNQLLQLSGSDFHEYLNYELIDVINGGVMIPEDIDDSVMLAEYLRSTKDLTLIKAVDR